MAWKKGALVVRHILTEAAAGLLTACLSVPLCVAAGVLAYTPLGPDYIAQGAFYGVFCAILGGITTALARSSSFVVSLPTTPMGVIQGSFVASLLAGFEGDRALVLTVLPVCVVLVGIWQVLFAMSGVTKVIKFVPHPVMAGFVTGIGVLIAVHQLPALVGSRSLGDMAQAAMDRHHLAVPAFGLAVLALTFAIARLAPRLPNLLAALVVGTLAFHAVRLAAPELDLGPTVGSLGRLSFDNLNAPGAGISALLRAPGAVLATLLFASFTLAIVGTIDTFFALQTVQHIADRWLGPRRDVIGQGLGNMVCGLVGGVVASTSLSLTIANYRAGGRTRLSAIASSLALLAGLSLAPTLISSLPQVVLAAILIAISIRLVDSWSWQVLVRAVVAQDKSQRRRCRRDSAIVLAVMAATVFGQPVAGVSLGIGLSCVIFIIDMSRPVVANRRNATVMHSKRLRSQDERAVLAVQGAKIAIWDLQGVLFFGNAHDLAAELRQIDGTTEILILNLRRVTDVDTSGNNVLQQLAVRMRSSGGQVAVCGCEPAWLEYAQSPERQPGSIIFFGSVDLALEWAETRIIEAHGSRGLSADLPIEQADLVREIAAEDLLVLRGFLELKHYPAGSFLCRANDAAVELWIIKTGGVSVRVPGGRADIRLASLGPGCTVGEMGLLERRPRSADVYADEDVEAYWLPFASFEQIMRDHPRLGLAILAGIARQLANRLRDTSQELRLSES